MTTTAEPTVRHTRRLTELRAAAAAEAMRAISDFVYARECVGEGVADAEYTARVLVDAHNALVSNHPDLSISFDGEVYAELIRY